MAIIYILGIFVAFSALKIIGASSNTYMLTCIVISTFNLLNALDIHHAKLIKLLKSEGRENND